MSLHSNNKVYVCKNDTPSIDNSSIITVGKVLDVTIEDPRCLNSFKNTAYVGNNNFISTPNYRTKNLIFSKLVSTADPSIFVVGNRVIDYKLSDNSCSVEIAAFGDNTVYLIEAGRDIKLFRLEDNNIAN